jgi:hypothetical protein
VSEPEPIVGPAVVRPGGGLEFVVPDGYTWANHGTCRSCGEPVAWCLTSRGKRMPLNPDGVSHFATCPQATAWRKG